MLQSKDTTMVSEIKSFFTSQQKAMDTIFRIISGLSLSRCKFIETKQANNLYLNHNKLILLLLFPFFSIKDASHFKDSGLWKVVHCGKDVFYRLLNFGQVDWRKLGYSITKRLLRQMDGKTDLQGEDRAVRCLIVDDTDLPKTGRCFELVGRVYSHVTHRSLLGFKGLFLTYHDGKSLFGLDFSLHGEKGKNKKKPYGLTPKQLKDRFSKKRVKGDPNKIRHDEYFTSKIDNMIEMVGHAIKQGVRFEYLLADSWFTCNAVIKFIKSRRVNCHFLGMIKMGKTKYGYQGELLTARQILNKLKRTKGIRRSRSTKFHYLEVEVDFQGIPVKLFFSKASKRGKWRGLISTDLNLDFNQALKLYSTRWSIEVFFKEAKQYLRLGKCESTDFDAQIAHTSICLMQYNILSVAKRFESYETTGALFRQAEENSLEITVSERMWLILIELIKELSELFDIDTEEIMFQIATGNQKVMNLARFSALANAA